MLLDSYRFPLGHWARRGVLGAGGGAAAWSPRRRLLLWSSLLFLLLVPLVVHGGVGLGIKKARDKEVRRGRGDTKKGLKGRGKREEGQRKRREGGRGGRILENVKV